MSPRLVELTSPAAAQQLKAIIAARGAAPSPMPSSPLAPIFQLLPLLLRWNFYPDQDVHPSWLPRDWPLPYRRIGRYGAGGRRVVATCLRQRNGNLPPDFDFQSPRKRVLLLDGAALRRLAAYLGFAVHQPLFQMDGIGAQMVRQTRRYGVETAGFVRQRIPALPSLRLDTSRLVGRPSAAGNVVLARGYRLLLGLCHGLGEREFARVRYKLPRRVSVAALPPLSAAQSSHLWELLLLCLIPELMPQWDWLF